LFSSGTSAMFDAEPGKLSAFVTNNQGPVDCQVS
jgi:hypothetical protein